MADLTGCPGRASQQAPVDHDAGADAGRRLDVSEVRAVPAGAPGQLSQRAEVRVVLDPDRNPKALFHLGGDAEPNPAGKNRGRAGRAVRAVHGARDAHADAQYAGALHGHLLEDLGKHAGRHVERSSGLTIDVQVMPAFGEHVVAEIGDGNRDVAVPEVDAGHDL